MLLTPLELDIMRILWKRSPITVKVVHAALRPRRVLAYTTVMTTLGRMFRKGLVDREMKAHRHFYVPAVSYETARTAAIDHVVREYFDGEPQHLTSYLSEPSARPEAESAPAAASARQIDETLL